MRNINVRWRRQKYLCINQKGGKIYLKKKLFFKRKKKTKTNAMITLKCIPRHYFYLSTLLFLKYSFNIFTKLI